MERPSSKHCRQSPERGYFRRLDIGYHMEWPPRVFYKFRRLSCKSSGRDSDATSASGKEHGSRATFQGKTCRGRKSLSVGARKGTERQSCLLQCRRLEQSQHSTEHHTSQASHSKRIMGIISAPPGRSGEHHVHHWYPAGPGRPAS